MPSDDTPMTNRLSHGDDSGTPSQPDSYYETGGPKGPVPPQGSTTPETTEYIGWTPLPKHKSTLNAYDDKVSMGEGDAEFVFGVLLIFSPLT